MYAWHPSFKRCFRRVVRIGGLAGRLETATCQVDKTNRDGTDQEQSFFNRLPSLSCP